MKAPRWIGHPLGALLGGLLLVAGAGTCAPPKPLAYPMPQPIYETPFIPPVEIVRWYHRAEVCAGMQGNVAAVQWFVVPGPWGDPHRPTYGHWNVVRDSAGFVRRVEIVVNAILWRDSTYIMHESLHDILWRNGWEPPDLPAGASDDAVIANVHPSPPYGKCADTFYGKYRP